MLAKGLRRPLTPTLSPKEKDGINESLGRGEGEPLWLSWVVLSARDIARAQSEAPLPVEDRATSKTFFGERSGEGYPMPAMRRLPVVSSPQPSPRRKKTVLTRVWGGERESRFGCPGLSCRLVTSRAQKANPLSPPMIGQSPKRSSGRGRVHCHLVKISEIIFTVGCRADA